MNPQSNIAVISNVFQVQSKYVTPECIDPYTGLRFCASGVCKDPAFRRQICDRNSLKKLAQHFQRWGVDERQAVERMKGLIEPWQIEVFFRQILDGGCGCPNVGKTVGVVRRNGRIEVVCRCPNGLHCPVPQNVDLLTLPKHQ
jgi:hypothetical protein